VTLANYITFFRIAMIPVIALAIAFFTVDDQAFRLAAAVIYMIVALSDWADGIIARKFDQRSRLGERLDPTADKLLTNITLVFIAVNPHFAIPIPMWLPVVVMLRDSTILIGSYLAHRFFGPLKPRARVLGKVTAWTQGITIAGVLLQAPVAAHLIWVMVVVTAVSFIDYCLFGYERVIPEMAPPMKESH